MPEPETCIHVLIADDHPVVRQGLRMMLEMADGFKLIGEATDGEMAVRLTAEHQPAVVLMDLRMPGMDGLEAIAQIRDQWPHVAVLMLTTYNGDTDIHRAMQAGAQGYVLKNSTGDKLIPALRAVAGGAVEDQHRVRNIAALVRFRRAHCAVMNLKLWQRLAGFEMEVPVSEILFDGRGIGRRSG